MAMQGSNSAPARNQSSAAAIPSKVGVGSGTAAPNTAKSVDNGSGPTGGSSQKGFSGNGLLPGKIKI